MSYLQRHRFNFGFNLRKLLVIGAALLALAPPTGAQVGETKPTADFYYLVNSTGGKFKDADISWTVDGTTWHTLDEAKALPGVDRGNGRVRFKLTDPVTHETYEDYVEWAQNGAAWFGNTSQVEAFVIPLTMELFNSKGESSRVGIDESRSALFEAFKKEAPKEFQACVIGDKKIISPDQADLGRGKPYADYFDKYIDETWVKYAVKTTLPDGWTAEEKNGALMYTPPGGAKPLFACARKPTTEEALLGTGLLTENPQFSSAINRHVLDDPGSFKDVSKYYLAEPCNFYAAFWHRHSLDGKADTFCYDDYNQQDTLLHFPDAAKLVVTLYWDTPPPTR